MRVEFGSQQSDSDEVQQYLRVARLARAGVGVVIVAAIAFMMVASLPQSESERGLHDASVNEMQLYALPPEQGVRNVEPAPTAGAAKTAPTAGAANRTLDEELRSPPVEVHHG